MMQKSKLSFRDNFSCMIVHNADVHAYEHMEFRDQEFIICPANVRNNLLACHQYRWFETSHSDTVMGKQWSKSRNITMSQLMCTSVCTCSTRLTALQMDSRSHTENFFELKIYICPNYES